MTTQESIDTMNKVEGLVKLLGSGELERILKRAEEIEAFYQKFDSLETLLSYMRIIERKAYVLKEYLTIDEVADYLGVSKSQVYKMTSSRAVNYYKPSGKTVYINRNELNDWICRNRVVSQEEIDERARRQADRYNMQHGPAFTKSKTKDSHETR